MQQHGKTRPLRPKQAQSQQPGLEHKMKPRPQSELPTQRGSGKLQDKVAIITGGDSGIGRAVAIAFAKEGADVAVAYLNEHKDAKETKRQVEEEGRRCELIAGDIGNPKRCAKIVRQTMKSLGRLFRRRYSSRFPTVESFSRRRFGPIRNRTFRCFTWLFWR